MTDKLMYPRPRSSDFDVHYALHQLQEDEGLFLEFLADPDAVLSRFPLDDQSKDLIKRRDYDGMVAAGLHPIMVVQYQRHIEWGMKMTAAEAAR